MIKDLLTGILAWVASTEKVKMRALDIQKEGLSLQARQLDIQEKNSALERQEKMLRIAIAQSDLNARNEAQTMARKVPAPTPLAAVPNAKPEEPCKCDTPDQKTELPKMTEMEELKAEAEMYGIKFRANVTEATLKKKIREHVATLPDEEPPTQGTLGKNYTGDEVRAFCRAHMVTQKSVDNDKGRSATVAFLKELTGFEGPSEMEAQDNAQELLNKVAAACIELGLTLPEEEEL